MCSTFRMSPSIADSPDDLTDLVGGQICWQFNCNIPNVQCDLGGRNRRCFRRAGRKFLELDGFLLQQCTSHFSLPAVEAGKRYAILCTPTFYALPTLFRCSDRLIPLLFLYCQCSLLHGVLLAASLYFLDCSQKYIFSMVLFSHVGEIEERHGFIRRVLFLSKFVKFSKLYSQMPLRIPISVGAFKIFYRIAFR